MLPKVPLFPVGISRGTWTTESRRVIERANLVLASTWQGRIDCGILVDCEVIEVAFVSIVEFERVVPESPELTSDTGAITCCASAHSRTTHLLEFEETCFKICRIY